MKRLPRVVWMTTAIVLLLCALLLTGLRFFLPNVNHYQQGIIAYIEKNTDISLQIGEIEGAWQSFGPVFTLRDVVVHNPEVDATASKIAIELDIWRSILSLTWRFRDITFYQLDVDYKVPFSFEGSAEPIDSDGIEGLFLKQFNHFTLKNSQLTFLTPSEQKTTLILPELTWLNEQERHRAQGFVSLETINKQHGFLQVKLDVKDKNGILSDGTVYLQADNIDMQPWLSRWLRENTGLRDANFSLSSWVSIKNNRIDSGLLQLRQGEANWGEAPLAQNLQVNDLLIRMRRQGEGWLFNIPELNTLKTNEYIWPNGSVSVLYLPSSMKYNQQDHWRIRAKNIELERLSEILPTFSFVTPETVQDWQHRQPKGVLSAFSLDITPEQLDHTQIDMDWQNVSWKKWKQLPSVDHFTGVLVGNMQRGVLDASLENSEVDYEPEFKAPFKVSKAVGRFYWQNDDSQFRLWSDSIDVQAISVWANGQFNFLTSKKRDESDLSILAGISVTDAGDAWRYFPQKLMGQELADYLSKAIIAGKVDEATLVFKGDPAHFPFYGNDGQFQVFVPLHNATFEYDEGWPALFDLDINLDFQRSSLAMRAEKVKLGDAIATNLTADIPEYQDEMLFINADLAGTGSQIQQYFTTTPMKHSIGDTLDELQIGGSVKGELGLSIPLSAGKEVVAKGQVYLDKNDLFIKPIASKLTALSGSFQFNNGNLVGNRLAGHWFGQPVAIDFSTQDNPKNYQVNVDLKGNWDLAKIAQLPDSIKQKLAGSSDWSSQIEILLPNAASEKMALKVAFKAGLDKLKSRLPALDDHLLKELGSMNATAQGSTDHLVIGGDIGQRVGFNSQWDLSGTKLGLDKATVAQWQGKAPELPKSSTLLADLPPITNPNWFKTLDTLFSPKQKSQPFDIRLPETVTVKTPSLSLGGQAWKNIDLSFSLLAEEQLIKVSSENLKGELQIFANQPWALNIDYLYYNPTAFPGQQTTSSNDSASFDFSYWPEMTIHCQDCWAGGQKLGKINAHLLPQGNTLQLSGGTLTNSVNQLKLDAVWQSGQQNRTQIAGSLSGEQFDNTAAYYGVLVPIIDAPYTIDFQLNWQDVPWSPDIATLDGKLSTKLGKGAIAKMGGGRAGQLLRLVSFDALLRKLQFDFRDTFSNDFDFDSIKGSAKIHNGILSTKDVYIDGLVADIALSGEIDLVKRQINGEAVVTPEISATVGVATAFAVNPFAGAAVFAASKVLGPLWSKISVIRYRVTGSLDEPKIDEVLRQLKETQE
ncbi:MULTISPECIES: AsmA2 domain-containing protein YhdP [unclassified Providencia]|uniref:AsmA2 domain-containing protein YhdP n=1 Tax=unclassified Providencia TaxID=2633465 RepID=UPI001321AEDD|nr:MULTISPECIES: AsmA2 domain-containing protein YhdP [unclassified Providencia]MTB38929.1 AsmA2 domain-containing protein [Providencia sp. wls1949]MTC09857.1 AsmA2 domain-containing protein [Providencia sp. wls1948]